MPYDFKSRLGHTNRRMAQVASETVTYTRSGVDIVISAAPILRRATEVTINQSVLRVEIMEWGIDLDQIEFGDNYHLPKNGDTILRTNGEEYIVKSMLSDSPYAYTDSSRTRLLVTTQMIGSDE